MNRSAPPASAESLPEEFREPEAGTPAGRIFQAALVVFSRDGFSAATTRAIAHEAGLNQALVHYYFGSKAALYRRVLCVEMRKLMLHQVQGRLGVLPLREMLATFPGHLVEWFRAHPGAISLLRRELAGGGDLQREIILQLGPHGPLGVRKRLAQLQRQSPEAQALPIPDDHALALMLSLSYGMILVSPLFEVVLKLDINKESQWKGLRSSLEVVLRGGLGAEADA